MGIQAEAHITPLIKSWEPDTQREMGASSDGEDPQDPFSGPAPLKMFFFAAGEAPFLL